MKEIRWHGRGGQGAFTASKILGDAAVLDGKYALAFPSFGPERRGAPVMAFTKVSDKRITDRSVIHKCDYIVFLDETLYDPAVSSDLKNGGKILINSHEPLKYKEDYITAVNADKISQKILKRVVSNTAMLGLLVAVSDTVDAENIKQALYEYFPQEIADNNKKVIEEVVYEAIHKKHV